MYDPLVGRFLEVDPKSFAAGDPNLFRYVHNNPMNATDPSGLESDPDTQLVDLDAEISDKGTSQKLDKPEFPFEKGTGKVEVFTGVTVNGLSDVIRLKFSADVSVEHAHWLQITRSMVFSPKNEPKLQGMQTLDPICPAEKNAKWLVKIKNGTWHVDTGKDNTAFYDEGGGVYYRDKFEISIFDKPFPDLNQFLEKGTYEIKDFRAYLVSNGKVYYQVSWSVTLTEIRNGPASDIDYSYEASGGPVTGESLPSFLKTEKLPIGPASALLPKQGDPVNYKPPRLVSIPNPINLKPEK